MEPLAEEVEAPLSSLEELSIWEDVQRIVVVLLDFVHLHFGIRVTNL